MDNFTIYRESKKDVMATLAVRIRVRAPRVLQRLDDAFNRLYEL